VPPFDRIARRTVGLRRPGTRARRRGSRFRSAAHRSIHPRGHSVAAGEPGANAACNPPAERRPVAATIAFARWQTPRFAGGAPGTAAAIGSIARPRRPAERVPLNLTEVILAQGSTSRIHSGLAVLSELAGSDHDDDHRSSIAPGGRYGG
jgi:hypothetical protein